ncbi:hydrocephalus-inducing protein homolog [Cydia amplana]|uniref:hydrocephalus-inducing protein homolog n=1 Tax=Cydia amplana TaxID=1869771 RepID=UPI002FE5DBF7
MEIYRQFKQNGYFTADLYHLLFKKKIVDTQEVIIPSEYAEEMKLSTQERLQTLHKVEVDNIVTVGAKHNPASVVLEFTPKLLVFQNFKPNEKVTARFSVKNISKATTHLTMIYKECSLISVKLASGQLLSRLAPGISMTFQVVFRPDTLTDFVHKVTFTTENDQYVLPIFAMGPRPVFDFPDEISIPAAPLKVENHITVLVQNIGLTSAGFKLDTKCPFSVQPKSAYLNPNEIVGIKAIVKTMRQGHIEGSLFVLFETGEIFKIRLIGSTFLVSVQLEKQVVRFLETYNTMVRQQTFKITNKSEHLLTYMCMKNEDVIHDFDEKVKLAHILYEFKRSESAKCQKLVYYDVLNSDEHDRVYTRIFFDQIHSLVADESLHFQDTHFSITPIKGKIWPNKSTELTITFYPHAIGEFKAVAYLDIDGTPDRMPLSMVGTSLPPDIVLNLETLDMDRVYINKKYNFEVIAINKGHINGVIVYQDTPTLFGSHVTCSPALRCLRPGERDIFVISFSNSNQGPYFEEVNFLIRDTEVVLKLYLKGEVIYPSVRFSIPCLDFGTVSLGVPTTLEFDVINDSIVDLSASVKISSDGPEVSSILLVDYALAEMPKPEIPQWPREFDIHPAKIYLGPEATLSLRVTLTANLIRANQTSLELELEKSDSPPIILPVTFDARVPEIIPAPDINLRACFLDFPYQYEIQVQANEIKGYYTLLDQEEETTLQVIVGNKEGFIEPHSIITFPVTIRTCALGVQEYMIRINVFGLSKPVDICHVLECGIRPIVTCTPLALHWGQVKLLSRTRKTLTLTNDSPVVVHFRASVLNRDGKWQIQPSEGQIDPESDTDLCLTLYLVDADTYVNKAVVQLEKVKEILIPLSATGVGTSIVVGELRDRVILGRHFTNFPLNFKVDMENKGTRIHALEWSEHYKAPKTQPRTAGFFNLEPRVFKIAAGEKMELTITGVSHKVTSVKEVWYLVGSVEGINKKELLLECEIIAEFVDPKIEVSTSLLEFQYDFGPYSDYYKLTEIVTIKNVSKLPLDIDINVKSPFVIIKKKNTYKVAQEDADMCACICYRESDLDVANILKVGAKESKIYIDYLTLKPVEPLRKGALNFFQDINKIKMAFNLTQNVEERLEDQEIMKLQILFDTTKHMNLKSRIYTDSMRIQFKGHKNKDSVKIIGRINFPNILVTTPRIDFQCIVNSSIESKTIQLQNLTPLLVCFRFQWKKCVISSNVMVRYFDGVARPASNVRPTSKGNIRSVYPLHSIKVSKGPLRIGFGSAHASQRSGKPFFRDGKDFYNVCFFQEQPEIPEVQLPPCKDGDINTSSYYDTDTGFTKPGDKLKEIMGAGYRTPFHSPISLNNTSEKNDQKADALTSNIPASEDSAVIPVSRDVNITRTKIIRKIAPMIPFQYDMKFPWIWKFRKLEHGNKIDTNQLLRVAPFKGLMKPNDCQNIHIIFIPSWNINVKAVLECEVLGGPSEFISVTGQTSEIKYNINTQKLNFKIRSFHDNETELLILTNTARLVFEYKTYLNEPKFETELNGTILDLLPSESTLQSEEKIEIKVVVRPGVLGYFHSVFLLEIGHLPHIPIEVFGWGVIPQVYLSLPRPEIVNLKPETGYLAIPTLTEEYLSAISEIFSFAHKDHVNTPMTEGCFNDPDLQRGWHICSDWDGYPSNMDIDLAIERMLVIEHIKLRPEILVAYSTKTKIDPIAGFLTTPYVVDFGVVIMDTTVQCVVEVINYGPIDTKLHLAKPINWPSWLGLKLCGKLKPGESGKMEVTLSPNLEDFYELEQYVENTFKVEVPYGITIPVKVKALCAVPYLASNVEAIDFGSVRCGDKIINTISLKNVGKPTCIWYVTLKLKVQRHNPMTVLDNSGKFEPGEGGWLRIAFKPVTEMVYEGVLLFRFHMNPRKMAIPVRGVGIIPQVHVIGGKVAFPPTLPWAETTDNYFGFTNPCPFPIELIFAHSDQIWTVEEEIYQLLYKYYNKPEEMLVPAITPGAGMHKEIDDFYSNFKYRVKMQMEAEATRAARGKAAATTTKKPPKTPKTGKYNISPKTATEIVQRKFRSEAEIIADEIKALKDQGRDPLKECLEAFDHHIPSKESEVQSKGLIVFVHGTPGEEVQSQEMAYTIGMRLGIPTVNIDLCMVEALCFIDTEARTIIKSAMDEAYEIYKKSISRDDEVENEHAGGGESEDEFEVMLTKLKALGNSKNITTPRSKAGDKKKKESNIVEAMGSTTMFQQELTQELLADFFAQPKFHRGFVIDSLTSFTFNQPAIALTTIIKSKHCIQNIHLVLCQSEFSNWAQSYEEAQRENELVDEPVEKVYEEEEIVEIVKEIDEMDGEDFENLSPEFRSLYVSHGLETRRKKFLEKTGFARQENKTDGSAKESALLVKSSVEQKKTKKDEKAWKNTSEYMGMLGKYNEYYKCTYDSLVTIANNWSFEEGAVGFPLYGLNGQILGVQKKTKTKSETHVLSTDENEAQRGFPLTLIKCPCLHYKEALVNMFMNTPVIREALKEGNRDDEDILQCLMKRKEFTVLLPKTMPYIHHELPLKWCFLDELPVKKCECNQITDLNLLDDTTQDNVINVLSKWHCICGKKVTSSSTSTSPIPAPVAILENLTMEKSEESYYPSPLPLHSLKTVPASAKRIVLEPGDLVRCKYSFSPQWEGHFSVKRFVEVSGWPESRVDIHVTGICDLPRIDSRPKKMFANFVRRANFEDNVYKITYLDDLALFEFGPIFVGQNRIYEEEYTIDLKNSSLITADIDIEFAEQTNVFDLDKTFISLEPGCRGKLTVTAAPSEMGVHRSVLLFCVKDNPEIVTVLIQCSGVVPILEILPLTKNIDYGKLLLYRREDDRFIVKNDSILPIMWKVRNAEEFAEDFIISHTSGIVPRYDNQVVPVIYIACRVGVILQKILIIDIYDAEGRGHPMVVDQLQLSAECYDVMVECAYENPVDTCLDYGNVKVNSTYWKTMFLLNRGKYNIYYKLKKVKNFPEPSLLRSFEVVQECGVIPVNMKLVAIEFTCTPTTSMNLVNVPIYTCSLLDGSKKQVVVAKFPVCINLASFYNTFTLFPLGELNFNIIPIGTAIMKEVILNNTSKCPVTYEIVLPEQYQISASAADVKVKDNKLKTPPMKCGNFLILNEDNLMAPGTSRTIQMQFYASGPGMFRETIKFIISDTCPAEACGVPLRLVGIGAVPTLDFWNTENTFREHLIVKSLSDYKVPETSPHCVFVENSVTLHFFCVNVNTTFTAAIDLYNNGLVACALSMNLLTELNAEGDIFSLDKYETHIEPLQHKCLRIMFSPKALKEYRAILGIKLNLLNNQQQSFRVCLIGEGVVPRIKMVWPPMRQYKCSLLQMPVTCLGSVSSREIRFKNICSVKSTVILKIQSTIEERNVFRLSAAVMSENNVIKGRNDMRIKLRLNPAELAGVVVHYNPVKKGRTNCEIQLTIVDNPYEYFTVFCEAEGFMEDVILIGLEMLSMDVDLGAQNVTEYVSRVCSTVSTLDSKKKATKKKDTKSSDTKKPRSLSSSVTIRNEPACLKYILDFGGCELSFMQKRSIIMVNNSDKVYKFKWEEAHHLFVKPSLGYISPAEEKDLEIVFFSSQPVAVKKVLMFCNLSAVSDNSLTLDTIKGSTWDSRQTVTTFDHNCETSVAERAERVIQEQVIEPQAPMGTIKMIIMYSVTTEYTKYTHNLNEKVLLKDTFIYQTRKFDFKVKNSGKVPMKITWSFQIDEDFPTTIDKHLNKKQGEDNKRSANGKEADASNTKDSSKETLFSESLERCSVDTWFEVNLPFTIEPAKECLEPSESRVFTVTFSPLDAFEYKVLLKSSIDNLDPDDQNMFCKIVAKSLVPYCHLDIEESDYLISGRRKVTGVALPQQITVMEFNVLGSGCYKKSFNVINPTSEGYEFIFEMVVDKIELIPFHCNTMKGYMEGGTSCEVTFTFAPSAPGVYESQWKFSINQHNISINLLVVGLAREPNVVFVPTILIVRNSLVGFSITDTVMLTNNENEMLKFEFKGNSLLNESGKTPVIMEPESGILKPRSATPIKFIYTPVVDGPLSFKIFCAITYMTKYLTLCVNALSLSIRPKVTYFLIGNEHVLDSKAITNIHLDQTASTYTRTLTFMITNEGSSTFFYEWGYNSSAVKKYLTVTVEPRTGHVAPASQAECTLSFTLKTVPVQAFPVTLYIVDGPEYSILLHSEIEKPMYHFSCKGFDFGKCIINAPDNTYKKIVTFVNDDKVPILLALDFQTRPELLVDYKAVPAIQPKEQVKVKIFFRPKQQMEYDFPIKFWVNSLCEEIITVKGEGVKCLFDLYEGCEKSFDMGPVKVGSKIVRQIEVMNHSKVAIDASFIFKDMYPGIEDTLQSEATSVCLDPGDSGPVMDLGPSRSYMVKNYNDDKIRNQIAMDIQNALSSLKVIPKECKILPYRKIPLKIQFKPVGMISDLNVQLNMRVLNIERPLVRLSGSATGMSLCLSQDSLQFGRVRIRGCKILKVMLLNKGDFGARFWWQPLMSDEFIISPMQGHIAAHTNVTYTITYRPKSHNPFVKLWASCNIENYKSQELALYAACLDVGDVAAKTLYVECPVREVTTSYMSVTNPTDGVWLVLSELSPGPFSTLAQCQIEPNSVFDIPIYFKPKTMGKHENQLLYTNLGENALFVSVLGVAWPPNPNGLITFKVAAKGVHTELLKVHHITESPESYVVSTEVVKVVPDKFDAFYEIKHPETVKVWGETCATCRWDYACYGECEMHMKVVFVNKETREYQFYEIVATVTPSEIVDTLTMTSRARETVQREIIVRNPLAAPVTFIVRCQQLDCPSTIEVGRHSQAPLVMSYSPLVVGESEQYLEISNDYVGTYTYKMKLKCLPAKAKELVIDTPIGTRAPLRLRVQNRSPVKAVFTCEVTHPSITTDKEYFLGPFEKGKFLVYFEPTEVGLQQCTVSFDSPDAGEFVYHIKGTAKVPKPQGPFEIKAGGYTTITFKNVFMDSRTFKMSSDKQEFYVKNPVEMIQSKKDTKVLVYLNDKWVGGTPTGCLTIESLEPPEPRAHWTYFLQGIP